MTDLDEELSPEELRKALMSMVKEVHGLSRNLEAVLNWIYRLEALHPELFTPDDGK